MDLKQLRTFVAVAELGTVSKAAMRLRIAQPALSRQIIDLEKELDLALFDRVGRRLRLTGEGEQLLGNCRRLLGDASSLADQAQELRRGDSGVLRVTSAAHMIENVLSTFLQRYARHYPNVQVRFIEGIGAEVLPMIERGEAQLAIMLDAAIPAGNDHFGSSPLLPVEFWAACRPPLELGHDGSIDIRGLASYPLLVYDSSFLFRRTFDAACRVAALRPNIRFECRSPHALLALAEAGHGVAIIPSYLRLQRYTLKTLRLMHRRKPIQEPRSIFWDKRRALPRYAQGFRELLTEYVRKINPVVQPSSRFRRPRGKGK